MNYAIRILPVALEDHRGIYDFIECRSPRGAVAWNVAYEGALLRLRENPLICGQAPESEHLEIKLRQLFFKTPSGRNYRILFRLDADQITIYRLRGPGQAPVNQDDLD